MPMINFDGKKPKMGENCFVDPIASVIGQVKLGKDVSIWPMVVLRGDLNFIHIGDRSNIQDNSVLHVIHDCELFPGGCPVIVGEEVTVGHSVNLHGCTIGNRCLIGIGSVILDKAVVADDVIIGAHSLVSPDKKLESGYLYFGSPVKQIRKLKPEEIQYIKVLAEEYVELKNKYLNTSR